MRQVLNVCHLSLLLGAQLFPGWLLAQDDEKPTFPLETIYAKREKNAVRGFITHFKLSLSTGAGSTFMKHDLDNFGVFQRPGYAPRIFPVGTSVFPKYSNWVNLVSTDTLSLMPDSFLVSGDTAQLRFKGKALNIPINLTLHYEFLKRYRIGGGYSFEAIFLRDFNSTTFQDRIGSFQPTNPSGIMKKYYGFAGVSFYRLDQFLFTGDVQIGGYNPGNNFTKSLITKGVYVNLGVTVEQEFSENLRVFIRPSYDIKKYTLSIPGSGGNSIVHKMNAAYVQFGLTYSLPELPKCFLKDCKIQMNHAHGNKEYRSRVHPFYKKQNPGYGENHPKLIKDKAKNKRKLNPY
ncbi:MAG: hypothetical protein JNJ65_11545 [Cyclobacteriaceae bacterium]|nr:hypothetical protein [Cyclobacteriaceae bacterium]